MATTPVFLPGESQGWGSLVGCSLWGRTELDTTEETQQQQQQHAVFHPDLRNLHSHLEGSFFSTTSLAFGICRLCFINCPFLNLFLVVG